MIGATKRKQRTARACQPCRQRRVKCDGATPACKSCRESSEACIYRPAERQKKYVFKEFQPTTSQRFRQQSSNPDSSSPAGSQRTRKSPTNPLIVSPACENPAATPRVENRPNSLRIPFFRWFGPTGIAPGYKRFFVPVKDGSERQQQQQQQNRSRQTTALYDDNANTPTDSSPETGGSASEFQKQLFESDGLTPSSTILYPLLDTFFEYYSCHFPFIVRHTFLSLVEERKVPAILLNSMCALAALFSNLPVFQDQPAYMRGEVFCNKAKHLLVPLLNLPSYEVLESILMITWMELATCHDVGLWMYTGMAVRMAEDMGLHKKTTLNSREIENDHERLLYWAINMLDHIICFAVGRPLTTRREHVDVNLPAERFVSTESSEQLACPFASLIQVIQYQGLVNEEIRMLPEDFLDLSAEARQHLTEYGNGIVAYYTGLHPSLFFNVPNFKAHANKGQSGTFLMLHLWFNSVMISIHRPGIRFGQERHRESNLLCPESRQISLSIARSTSSMLSVAELVDTKSIKGSPFIDQAVEMAGLVFIAELRVPPPMLNSPHNPPMILIDGLQELDHQSNYQVCLRTLQLLTVYWRGLIWILTAMEQTYQGADETDPGETSVDPVTSVSLSDSKMISWLLKKVECTNNSWTEMRIENTHRNATIGVAVAGTTNSASNRTVTIFEAGRQYGVAPSLAPARTMESLAADVQYNHGVNDDNGSMWTFQLDDAELWNMGLELFRQETST